MNKPKQVSLIATEVHNMKSKVTGKNYEVSIGLPYAYNTDSLKITPFGKSSSKWPVIYVLDSMWFFDMVMSIVRYMAPCGRTSDAIIVGIGYPNKESLEETWRSSYALRTHDLTPMRSEKSEKYNSEWLQCEVKTGGGNDFFKFIKQELIPLIDEEYRTDPSKRIIVGHSHGGSLALFAMFQEPKLFSNYIASSPSVDFADNFMFNLESEYAKKHKSLPAQVFLSAGELEEVTDDDSTLTSMYRFAALLESRKYKGLSLKKQMFLDNNHCEVAALAFQTGLKLALRK